jgi:hypothetical protein
MKRMVDIISLKKKIENVYLNSELNEVLETIRLLSYNEKASKRILQIIELGIKKCFELSNNTVLINLYSSKIVQLQHSKKNMPIIKEIILKIRDLSDSIEYNDGRILYNLHTWYVNKFEGNKKKAKESIHIAMELMRKIPTQDKFVYFLCKYTYGVEEWLENNNPQSALILEECASFFYSKGFYRSLVQTLAILFVIYQETQNKKSALKTIKMLLSNKIPFEKLPQDIQAISHYFVGLSHKLQLNLSLAEEYLKKAMKILKETLENSMYSFYYIPVLSHFSTVLALQGKVEQALELVKEAKNLLQNKLLSSYFDPTSKKQITHSLNLVNFYVKSRVYGGTNKITELFDDIYNSSKVNYSNAIMLTEFLLNSELNLEQLLELRKTNNASLERVRHIIGFLIEKTKFNAEIDENQQKLNCIKVLQQRFKTDKMTFIEKAYADLLIAQQLFSLNRFAEIYPLLKKYEKQLHRIEVLELRVFMEAFIQIGAYKCGNPLGPALQYLAIKKCRMYGFSRLENILLNYLEIQKQEVLGLIT